MPFASNARHARPPNKLNVHKGSVGRLLPPPAAAHSRTQQQYRRTHHTTGDFDIKYSFLSSGQQTNHNKQENELWKFGMHPAARETARSSIKAAAGNCRYSMLRLNTYKRPATAKVEMPPIWKNGS
ncbi:unnamed protein product [Ectocarpus sp. 12 AP-2014]